MKSSILNQGYARILKELEAIMEADMRNKEIEEMFDRYAEFVNSDEAAAILTLAEVIKGKEGHPSAKEGHSSEQPE
jgi:hypothetical protein